MSLCPSSPFKKTSSRIHSRIALGIFACVLALTGCSSSSAPSVVMAQSGYSVASLSGVYAFQLAAPYDKNTPGLFYEQLGTLTADGAGTVTAGTSTAYFSNSTQTCAFTFTGTYTVQSSGAGAASLTFTPTASSPSGCVGSTAQIAFLAAGSGSSFVFVDTDGSIYSGTAIKQ